MDLSLAALEQAVSIRRQIAALEKRLGGLFGGSSGGAKSSRPTGGGGRRRLSAAARAKISAAASLALNRLLAPLLLLTSGGFLSSARGLATPASPIFQPWQLFWFFGHHGALVHGAFGAPKPGFRVPPSWSAGISHPLVIGVAGAITAALWLRTRRLSERDALLALALLLFLRCLLDTWDVVYYPLPFLLALLAWEVRGPVGRPPVLALSSTVLVWFSFHWLHLHASPDVQAASFLLWALPLTAWLCLRVYRLGRPAIERTAGGERRPGPQETTVSALGRLLSTS